jgi:hypothetical protein
MAEWSKKIPETDEEINEAILWMAEQGILPSDDPAVVRLRREKQLALHVDPKLMDDIRDLMAIHGAGSYKRQFKAKLKNDLSDWGNLALLIFLIVVFGGYGLVFVGFLFGWGVAIALLIFLIVVCAIIVSTVAGF